MPELQWLAKRLADEPTVVGFLVTDGAGKGGRNGLRDVTVALDWAQKNIREMGGDAARVAGNRWETCVNARSDGVGSAAGAGLLASGQTFFPTTLRAKHACDYRLREMSERSMSESTGRSTRGSMATEHWSMVVLSSGSVIYEYHIEGHDKLS